MKSSFRITVMLLVACSLQNCQDVLESLESTIVARKDKNAFTISHLAPEYTSPYDQFMVSVDGTAGSIVVNWGDGTSATYDLGGQYGVDLIKRYESPGRYHISITGDLKNITGFKSSYGQGPFDAINLKPLTGLRSLRIDAISGPEVIDVTHCKNLEELTLTDMSALREIRLPQQHSLWAVSIAASTNLTPSTVDALINSVYKTAVKKQIWGFLHVRTSHFEEGGTEMVGPPSPKSIAQLTELQNVYNWEISPVM